MGDTQHRDPRLGETWMEYRDFSLGLEDRRVQGAPKQEGLGESTEIPNWDAQGRALGRH